jgi:hypothetical protein
VLLKRNTPIPMRNYTGADRWAISERTQTRRKK